MKKLISDSVFSFIDSHHLVPLKSILKLIGPVHTHFPRTLPLHPFPAEPERQAPLGDFIEKLKQKLWSVEKNTCKGKPGTDLRYRPTVAESWSPKKEPAWKKKIGFLFAGRFAKRWLTELNR